MTSAKKCATEQKPTYEFLCIKKSAMVVGNTIATTMVQQPARDWVFTLNNYSIEDRNVLIEKFKDTTKYYVIGREKGKEGTNHLQGFVQFKKKSVSQVFKK